MTPSLFLLLLYLSFVSIWINKCKCELGNKGPRSTQWQLVNGYREIFRLQCFSFYKKKRCAVCWWHVKWPGEFFSFFFFFPAAHVQMIAALFNHRQGQGETMTNELAAFIIIIIIVVVVSFFGLKNLKTADDFIFEEKKKRKTRSASQIERAFSFLFSSKSIRIYREESRKDSFYKAKSPRDTFFFSFIIIKALVWMKVLFLPDARM